jgi:LAO/AO transport system kinase
MTGNGGNDGDSGNDENDGLDGNDGVDGRSGDRYDDLVADLLSGNHRALARTITHIEDRAPGYRELVSALHGHTGSADVIGITGSPGSGKSTLVDRMAEHYREAGLTVGIVGVDPSSPFTGGAVLGDRIRMSSTTGGMEVFFRSMSARGSLGGLSTATADAVKALDAFGKDKVLVETVGAGQNEVDVVKTADTVCVLVPPGSGDDVQMLKAGILEIGDVFVVNKADLEGADRTVTELREMIEGRSDRLSSLDAGGRGSYDHREGHEAQGHGHHGGHGHRDDRGDRGNGERQDRRERGEGHGEHDEERADGPANGANDADAGTDAEPDVWTPRIVETVAKSGSGVEEFLAALDGHRDFLERSGRLERQVRRRYTEEIRGLLREDSSALIEREVAARGGIDAFVDRVVAGETDPYAVAEEVIAPFRNCLAACRDDTAGRDDAAGQGDAGGRDGV